jgi:hypothetical protein
MATAFPWVGGEVTQIYSTSIRQLGFAPCNQLCSDHVALDLVGAFADDHPGRVAEVAFHVVFGGVAVAAVDAHRVQRDLHRGLGRE